MNTHYASLLLGVFGCVSSQAIELRLDPSNPTPPSFTFDASQDTRTLILSLYNDDGSQVNLAGVQLNLMLAGDVDSQGDLELAEIGLPTGSLFEGLSQPTIRLAGETTSASVDTFPIGPVIDANAAGDLYQITLTGFGSAQGNYQLMANAAMPSNLPESSHWLSLSAPFGIRSFTNPVDPATGRLVLGTVTVLPVPEGEAGVLALLTLLGAAARPLRPRFRKHC